MRTTRISHRLGLVFAFAAAICPALLGQAPAPATADPNDTKIDEIIKETQQQIGGKQLAGLVWWVPAEFWEESAIQQGSSPQQARETFGSLRQYTMVIVLAGKIGIGNVNWYPESEVRASTTLRDSEGQIYKPLTDISSDAVGVTSIIKPVMANILGPAGQNLNIMFFPGKTAAGKAIADPTRDGSFTVLIDNLGGQQRSAFEWRLPLTSMTPPRFCPLGKERMEASWKFCPWHGNKLENLALPPAIPEPKKKDEKSPK